MLPQCHPVRLAQWQLEKEKQGVCEPTLRVIPSRGAASPQRAP